MINKEGIVFAAVIAIFAILFIAQLIVAGYAISNAKKRKNY